MACSPDRIFSRISRSDQITDDARLDIFEFLSQTFSIIPLRGGFPTPGQDSSPFKAPLEKGWQKWCLEKRPFNRTDFKPERAGIACGPASGLLVLDIDDLDRFWEWMYLHAIKKNLPETMVIQTGGLGERYHYYFR